MMKVDEVNPDEFTNKVLRLIKTLAGLVSLQPRPGPLALYCLYVSDAVYPSYSIFVIIASSADNQIIITQCQLIILCGPN